MGSEIRVDAWGMPDEEYRKLPYLLKWLKVVMMEEVGELRMAESNEGADILLVDIEAIEDREGAGRQDAPGPREIFVARDRSRLGTREAGATYPLQVGDLQRCFEQVVAEWAQTARDTAATRGSGGGYEATEGNPEPGPNAANVDRLIVPLLDQLTGSDLRLEGVEGVEVVVSPGKGYRSPLYAGDFARLEGAINQAQWQPVAKNDVGEASDWKPLTRLIWLLAYYGARDGLLPRVPRDRPFALAGWPDYAVIPMEANNIKVWAYLKGNPADVDTIARATGLDRAQVVGSLNAGYLCGQVQLGEGTEKVPETKKATRNKGVLAQIRQRLGLPSGHPSRSGT